jgi:hypothetical protein
MINKQDIIGPDTVLQRKADVLFNTIEEEIIMLSIKNGEYYSFGMVGSRIWEILEKPTAYKTLIEKLQEEFEVSIDQCTNETMEFIRKLEDKKMILHN